MALSSFFGPDTRIDLERDSAVVHHAKSNANSTTAVTAGSAFGTVPPAPASTTTAAVVV